MKKLTAVLLSTALLHSFSILAAGKKSGESTRQEQSTWSKFKSAINPSEDQGAESEEEPENQALLAPSIAPIAPADLLKQTIPDNAQLSKPITQPALQKTETGSATVVDKKEDKKTESTPTKNPTTTEEKKEIILPTIEGEPSWWTRLTERFSDPTYLALWILTNKLDKNKKDHLIHNTHQLDRGILDSIAKAQQTIKANTQPNNIDRLQAILRTNKDHQNNLKTILNGSVNHSLQLNDVALNDAFEFCNLVRNQEVEYLKEVADEIKATAQLTQQIQTLILQLKTKKDKSIPAQEYATMHTVISDIKALP